jgi:hypothetical protein
VKVTPSLRIAGGLFGIPMLAVAIVALFWGSTRAFALGLFLGAAALYLVWSAVHVITDRSSKPTKVPRQPGVGGWVLRGLLGLVVGLFGFVAGMLAVSHKCSAGIRIVETAAPWLCGLSFAGIVVLCRRYALGFLLVIILFGLLILGSHYYIQAIHRGAPEATNHDIVAVCAGALRAGTFHGRGHSEARRALHLSRSGCQGLHLHLHFAAFGAYPPEASLADASHEHAILQVFLRRRHERLLHHRTNAKPLHRELLSV